MNKHVVKVIVAGVGAAFVLTACVVSNRQVITGPNGLVTQPLDVTTVQSVEDKAVPVELKPAEERAAPPAKVEEQAPQTTSNVENANATTATTATAAKAAEQSKAAETTKATMGHGCQGYGDYSAGSYSADD